MRVVAIAAVVLGVGGILLWWIAAPTPPPVPPAADVAVPASPPAAAREQIGLERLIRVPQGLPLEEHEPLLEPSASPEEDAERGRGPWLRVERERVDGPDPDIGVDRTGVSAGVGDASKGDVSVSVKGREDRLKAEERPADARRSVGVEIEIPLPD